MRHLARTPAYRSRGFALAIIGLGFWTFICLLISCFSFFIPAYRRGGCLTQIFFGFGGLAGFVGSVLILRYGSEFLRADGSWIGAIGLLGVPLGGALAAEFALWFKMYFVGGAR